jgi:hypothetical protein
MTAMIIFVITELVLNLEGKMIIDFWYRCPVPKFENSDDSEGKRVKRVCEFWDERYVKNRSITDIDWSPKVSLCPYSVTITVADVVVSILNSVLPPITKIQRR